MYLSFNNIEIIRDYIPKKLFLDLKNESMNTDEKDLFVSGLTNSYEGVAKHINVTKNFKSLSDYMNDMVLKFSNRNTDFFKFPLLTKDLALKLTKAWFNFQNKGEFVPSHLHEGVFSFVIWLQLPIQSKFAFMYTDLLGQTQENEIILSKKDEGTILFFPAKLRHQVYPFYTNETRVSLSGNILFEVE